MPLHPLTIQLRGNRDGMVLAVRLGLSSHRYLIQQLGKNRQDKFSPLLGLRKVLLINPMSHYFRLNSRPDDAERRSCPFAYFLYIPVHRR